MLKNYPVASCANLINDKRKRLQGVLNLQGYWLLMAIGYLCYNYSVFIALAILSLFFILICLAYVISYFVILPIIRGRKSEENRHCIINTRICI